MEKNVRGSLLGSPPSGVSWEQVRQSGQHEKIFHFIAANPPKDLSPPLLYAISHLIMKKTTKTLGPSG